MMHKRLPFWAAALIGIIVVFVPPTLVLFLSKWITLHSMSDTIVTWFSALFAIEVMRVIGPKEFETPLHQLSLKFESTTEKLVLWFTVIMAITLVGLWMPLVKPFGFILGSILSLLVGFLALMLAALLIRLITPDFYNRITSDNKSEKE